MAMVFSVISTPLRLRRINLMHGWFVLAMLIGFIACQWYFTYPLTAIVVYLWCTEDSRVGALRIVGVYTLFSTWVVVPAIVDYLEYSYESAVGIWLLGVVVVMLPWVLLYRRDSTLMEVRVIGLLVLSTVPPIGLIQFASPFVGTSLLIPGLGFVSIGLGVVAISVVSRLVNSGVTSRGAGCTAILLLGVLGIGVEEKSAEGWVPVNTAAEVGGIHHTIKGSMEALQAARKVVLDTNADVVVLGESTGGFSLAAGEMLLTPVQRRTVVVAGGRQLNRQALFVWEGERSYIAYEQRIRPILLGHMEYRSDGHRTVLIDGLKVAPLICYEGSIMWGMISAMAASPEHILSIANFHWSRNSGYFSRVLHAHIRAWGRVFKVSTTVAVNGSS